MPSTYRYNLFYMLWHKMMQSGSNWKEAIIPFPFFLSYFLSCFLILFKLSPTEHKTMLNLNMLIFGIFTEYLRLCIRSISRNMSPLHLRILRVDNIRKLALMFSTFKNKYTGPLFYFISAHSISFLFAIFISICFYF